VNARSHTLSALRRGLAALDTVPAEAPRVGFGHEAVDRLLGGGLVRRALHEIHAAGSTDMPAASGFAMGLARRAAEDRPIVWIRQDFLDVETGRLHPPGLLEHGIDPHRVLVVRARDATEVLRAAGEAVRCPALGAVIVAPWGRAPAVDLTASRRLLLAAEASGVLTLMLRVAAEPAPSAALTRWQVEAAPSRPLEANAPGYPAFAATLLRHRGGLGERRFVMEWDRDAARFRDTGAGAGSGRPALPRFVAPLPADRPAPAAGDGFRRAG
jgi:protein ImuA